MENFVETKIKGIFINKFGVVKSVGRLSNHNPPKRLKDRVLEHKIIKGYPHVLIHSKLVRLHILLAETFIPKEEGKNLVLHKNDIKTDFSLDNLYWGTHSDNLYDRYKNVGNFVSREKHPKFIKEIDVYIGLPNNFKRLLKDRGLDIKDYSSEKVERYYKKDGGSQWIYKFTKLKCK